jgi:hypothetical protein
MGLVLVAALVARTLFAADIYAEMPRDWFVADSALEETDSNLWSLLSGVGALPLPLAEERQPPWMP